MKGKDIDPFSLLGQLLTKIGPSRVEIARERERLRERNRLSKLTIERRNKKSPKG